MGIEFILAVFVSVASLTAPQQQTSPPKSQKASVHHAHKKHHAKRATEPHTQAAAFVNQGPLPPPPETAEPEIPPPPPPPVVVAYEGGALAIRADDAELRDILDKVHQATGASVDAPVLEQRVSVRLEPQPPVQAIAALVDGLHLDYAVLGGTGVRDPLERIILTPHGVGFQPAPATAAAVPPEPQENTENEVRPSRRGLAAQRRNKE
jgi:hypothetical protein